MEVVAEPYHIVPATTNAAKKDSMMLGWLAKQGAKIYQETTKLKKKYKPVELTEK